MSGSETRASLLVQLRDPRNGDAWNAFVDVYGPLVFGHCRRRGLSEADADDVTQRVFGRTLTGIRRLDYDRARGRFRDWLGRVTRNEVYRFFRERGRHPAGAANRAPDLVDDVQSAPVDPEWVDSFHARVLQVALDRARPRFEPDTWAAFEGVWVHNRPPAEVAAALGQSADWVYVAKSRVLKALQAVVEELADDLPI